MLSRQQQLQYCNICKNRKKTPDSVIVCQLTDKKADFSDSCEYYEKDSQLMEANMIRRRNIRKQKLRSDFVFGLDRIGIKNGIVAGILLLFIGIIWLIVGINFGYIFWYPTILILMGVTALIIGVFNSIRRSIARDQSMEDQIDDVIDQ